MIRSGRPVAESGARLWPAVAACVFALAPGAAGQEAGSGASGGMPPPAPAAADEASPAPLGEATPGPVVTLEDAFEYARARHPQIRAIRIDLEKADAMLRQAWGALLPRVSGQIMYTLNDQETVADFSQSLPELPFPIETTPIVLRPQHIVQGQIQIAAPLFNMPILSAIDMAGMAGPIASLSEEEASRQLLLGVSTAYYGSLAARQIIDLQADAFETAKDRLRAARVRLTAGAGVRIDVARAELEVETARLAHEAALLSYDNAREALAGLLVMDELPVPAPPAEDAVVPDSADDLVAEAIERRPDMLLREAKIDLADEQLWSAWAPFFPTLSLAWQLNTEITEPAGFGGRRNAWALVLLLSIPVYDQSRYGLLDQRRAEIRQAEIELEGAALAIRTEIRSALREYQSSLTTIETAERQVSLAREALGLAEAGMLAGAATSLDVADAQQMVNQALVNVAIQEYKSRLALVRVLFLAGRLP